MPIGGIEDMCGKKVPLISMGDERTHQVCADGEHRPPSARAEIICNFLHTCKALCIDTILLNLYVVLKKMIKLTQRISLHFPFNVGGGRVQQNYNYNDHEFLTN